MSLIPLLDASLIIQLHFLSAMPTLIVGPFSIWGRSSRRTHKWLGYTWVIAMAVLAITGLLIPSNGLAVIGYFGPIHLFSVFALWGVSRGVWLARARRFAEHQVAMRSTWFGAMGIAGLLNFIPGRTVNQMVFGGPSDFGWAVIAAGFAALFFIRKSPAYPFARPS
jgi:uncharacterized membrane protein